MTDNQPLSGARDSTKSIDSSKAQAASYTHDNVLFRVASDNTQHSPHGKVHQAEQIAISSQLVKFVAIREQYEVLENSPGTRHEGSGQKGAPQDLLEVGAQFKSGISVCYSRAIIHS